MRAKGEGVGKGERREGVDRGKLRGERESLYKTPPLMVVDMT